MSSSRFKQPFGALMIVRNNGGEIIGRERDYRKAIIDAAIIAAIAGISVLMAFGFPPSPEAIYSTLLALMFGFFTSLARKLNIDYEKS